MRAVLFKKVVIKSITIHIERTMILLNRMDLRAFYDCALFGHGSIPTLFHIKIHILPPSLWIPFHPNSCDRLHSIAEDRDGRNTAVRPEFLPEFTGRS